MHRPFALKKEREYGQRELTKAKGLCQIIGKRANKLNPGDAGY